ncbi:MAG: hypothetical protein LBH32_04335 [Dysgonamonadaceae bacterium]|jgi:hypothetical protein|nr:hypothetical protein [Dysgonamonadaceae bacterium]
MKKITFLFAALMLIVANNVKADSDIPANTYPSGDGILHYVMYDCSTEQIIQTLPEVDQTFTLAIDITGHAGLLSFINDWSLTSPGQKSIAMHLWAGDDSGKACDVRLMHIKGNIYGATINLKYLVGNAQANPVFPADFLAAYETPGTAFYFHAIVLGFGYGEAGEGLDWWNPGAHGTGGFGLLHVGTAPYTGAYASDKEFYGDDDTNNPYIFYQGASAGLAAPCTVIETGITSVSVDSPIVNHEYYNLQGAKLSRQPESGLFIDKAIKANGTSSATKISKLVK